MRFWNNLQTFKVNRLTNPNNLKYCGAGKPKLAKVTYL